MKFAVTLVCLIALASALQGCSTPGLSVNWEFHATYTSDVPVGTRKGQ